MIWCEMCISTTEQKWEKKGLVKVGEAGETL